MNTNQPCRPNSNQCLHCSALLPAQAIHFIGSPTKPNTHPPPRASHFLLPSLSIRKSLLTFDSSATAGHNDVGLGRTVPYGWRQFRASDADDFLWGLSGARTVTGPGPGVPVTRTRPVTSLRITTGRDDWPAALASSKAHHDDKLTIGARASASPAAMVPGAARGNSGSESEPGSNLRRAAC